MIKEFTCIVCPNGCSLAVEDGRVTGNKCPRGKEFALQEIKKPKRSLTTTVKTIYKDFPVVPVKVVPDIELEKFFDVMNEINHYLITSPILLDEVVIKNVAGTGSDVIMTSNLLKEKNNG